MLKLNGKKIITSQCDGSFEHPKQMFKRIDNYIFYNLNGKFCFCISKHMKYQHIQTPFFLFLNRNFCCGCLKEPYHLDGSFEYPQHMFKLMVKKLFTI